MNLNIEGLVVVGDDTLINLWNTFNMQRFHLSHVARSKSWFNQTWGMPDLNRTLIDLEARRMGIINVSGTNVSAGRFDKMVLQHWDELIGIFGKREN